ncbi:MAG: hypothetical protein Q8M65_09500 [Rhodoglobus sp.]|nr:hypothetical protein [Rhodoglobus sp.]
MGRFTRGLHPSELARLGELSDAPATNWWKDLLSSWRPSGSGQPGLRLAVRDRYLNFYWYGQSIARVEFGATRSGKIEPRAMVHAKYVYPGEMSQSYASLVGETVTCVKLAKPPHAYAPTTFNDWISACEPYVTPERRGVDILIRNHGAVFDVEAEMTTARTQAMDSAKVDRIDLVALEVDSDRVTAVFYEAKTYGDGRLRAKVGDAKIVSQLRSYRTELQARPEVAEACRSTCRTLVALHAMAPGLPRLNPLVADVAMGRELVVDPVPRLVIFAGIDRSGARCRTPGNWSHHREKLRLAGIPIVEHVDAAAINLSGAWAAATS